MDIKFLNKSISKQEFIDSYFADNYKPKCWRKIDSRDWEKDIFDYVSKVKMFLRINKIEMPRWIIYCQDTAQEIIDLFNKQDKEIID